MTTIKTTLILLIALILSNCSNNQTEQIETTKLPKHSEPPIIKYKISEEELKQMPHYEIINYEVNGINKRRYSIYLPMQELSEKNFAKVAIDFKRKNGSLMAVAWVYDNPEKEGAPIGHILINPMAIDIWATIDTVASYTTDIFIDSKTLAVRDAAGGGGINVIE